MKKFSKIFMIFCVLFSQFNGALTVFAEELMNDDNQMFELEESVITVSFDDEYNLVVKSDGKLDDDSNYDVYLTSSYKYAYDGSEIPGYNEEKINEEETILGSVFNSEEGYSVSVESIETVYNGEFSVIVEVVDTETGDVYSAAVTKIVSQEDSFDVYANDTLVEENTYTVDSENKEVTFVPVINLYSTIGTVVPSIYVNDSLLEDSYIVNYEGMLYGTYSYDWNVLLNEEVYTSYNVSVIYDSLDGNNESANAEILTNVNTAGVRFLEENVYVAGEVSVLDFVNSVNMIGYEVEVIDSEGTYVTEGNVSNGMALVISKDGLVLTYAIATIGDVDSDDVTVMVESILSNEEAEEYYNASADVNVDGVVDIFDVTKAIDVLNNGWDNEVVVDNETLLNPVLSSDVTDEVKIGDTITVRFALNNFDQNMINGLSGQIEYDSNILSLDKVVLLSMDDTLEPTMEVKYNSETGKFIVYGDDYNNEETFIELTFTAIGASTEEYISISSLVAAYAGEEVLLTTDSVSMMFEVTYTSNVGGDVEEKIEEETEEKTENTLVNNIVYTNNALSADSYLYDLTIEGVDFDFSPYTFSYNIKVGNEVTSLDLNVVLSDYRATYAVYGNENFEVGENIVTVVVTAEDGSTHTYTLIVEKEEDKEEVIDDDNDEEVEESSVSKTVIVILIILVIIGLIYLIFKDDEEDKEKKD